MLCDTFLNDLIVREEVMADQNQSLMMTQFSALLSCAQ